MRQLHPLYQLDEIKTGDVFYDASSRKCHFVGTLKDGDDTLFVYWRYNKYSQRRVYCTEPAWEFEITLHYSHKTP
jgi:hypothetical protein